MSILVCMCIYSVYLNSASGDVCMYEFIVYAAMTEHVCAL